MRIAVQRAGPLFSNHNPPKLHVICPILNAAKQRFNDDLVPIWHIFGAGVSARGTLASYPSPPYLNTLTVSYW
jgi:hypothetical protein